MSTRAKPAASTLVVDVDDSLLRCDLLWEQAAQLAAHRPALLPLVPFWLLRGRAHLKARLAEVTKIDVESLPLRPEVAALVEAARAEGRPVVLASASNERLVEPLARRVGATRSLASTETRNLKGRTKYDALREELGDRAFEYVGDSRSDLEVWRHASKAIVVNPSRSLWKDVEALGVETARIDDARRPLVKRIVKLLRVHQWSKNVLIAMAPVAGHSLLPALKDGSLFLAFVAFSALASAGYLVNDLRDVAEDRRHATKRSRPLASGDVPAWWALALVPILLAVVALAAWRLPAVATVQLLVYAALNTGYQAWARSRAILDVVFLAAFYTVRIMFGGAATSTPVSEWLLSFSAVFFFGLALAKRMTELRRMEESSSRFGRGYDAADRPVVLALGVTSSLMSALVTMLYFASDKVRALYSHPEHLWLILPLQLYWLSRLWLFAARGTLHDDPVLFAVKDRASWAVAVFGAVIVWYST